MRMNKVDEIILLQKLEQHLAYYKYDQLGLSTLIKMRNEVHGRIEGLVHSSGETANE